MPTLAPRSANASASGKPTCPHPPMTTTSRSSRSGTFVTPYLRLIMAGPRGSRSYGLTASGAAVTCLALHLTARLVPTTGVVRSRPDGGRPYSQLPDRDFPGIRQLRSGFSTEDERKLSPRLSAAFPAWPIEPV